VTSNDSSPAAGRRQKDIPTASSPKAGKYLSAGRSRGMSAVMLTGKRFIAIMSADNRLKY
jgi:hypothetical protein